MGLEQDFEQAIKNVESLTTRPDNDTLLSLYGWYKQAKFGDCNISQPSIFDPKGRAKWNAWNDVKGLDKEKAMKYYIRKANKLTK